MRAKSESVTGKTIETMSQFLVGFIGAGKFLKAPTAASAGVKLAIGAGKGAIADFTVMDPYQERLSNILHTAAPELLGPVTRFLSADKNDSQAVARLKNAAEGAALGIATDAFIGIVTDCHLTIDPVLLRSAKIKAIMEGRRIGAVVTELLKNYVTTKVSSPSAVPSTQA